MASLSDSESNEQITENTMQGSQNEDDDELEDASSTSTLPFQILPKDFDYTQRICKDVSYPATKRLEYEDLINPETGVIDHTIVRDHLKAEGRLSEDAAARILHQAEELLKNEETLLQLEAPLTVCGDVHGQFFDLIKLFQVGGDPKTTKYLFLGDYVDRGNFGVETVLYLYSIKIQYPDQIFMIRGNHECAQLTEHFTFKEECIVKYSEDIYLLVMVSFQSLPLAALMNQQFLCVHGGISPETRTLDDIRKIDRFKEPPPHGIMTDLLWSDPNDDYGFEVPGTEHFTNNRQRGCSFSYSYEAVTEFLRNNGLLSLIRAHEVQDEGFKLYKQWKIPRDEDDDGGSDSTPIEFPSLISLFSAPKYSRYTNKAAILQYADGKLNIESFQDSEQPYWLPDFLDVFTWSMPFVAEKVSDMVVQVLNICSDEELKEEITEQEVEAYKGFQKALEQIKQTHSTMKSIRDTMAEEKVKREGGDLAIEILKDSGRTGLGAAENILIQKSDSIEQARKMESNSERMPVLPEEPPKQIGRSRGSIKGVRTTLSRVEAKKKQLEEMKNSEESEKKERITSSFDSNLDDTSISSKSLTDKKEVVSAGLEPEESIKEKVEDLAKDKDVNKNIETVETVESSPSQDKIKSSSKTKKDGKKDKDCNVM